MDISVDAMRTMYRGRSNPKHPTKLNQMDGFSTAGPILFYIDGLKEGIGKGTKKLIGPNEMDLSTTDQSMTLLFDIDNQVLVPHFAEIDHLDEGKPLVIVQPSRALDHNRRYAVVVVGANDENGIMLPVSNHLKLLLNNDKDLSIGERKRANFYLKEVLPTLLETASFLQQTETIQLLFDFHTTSEESQIGHTRKIIGSTLKYLDAKELHWNESNVRSIRVIDKDCSVNGEVTARIIHGSIDLPHFLKEANTRISELDVEALETETPTGLFTVKFLVTIPCSISSGDKPVRAIVDYGHGFLDSRNELIERGGRNFLQR